MTVTIDTERVGSDRSPYVLAACGLNHDGEPARARSLLRAAASADANAIGFAVHDADRVVTRGVPARWADTTQYEAFAATELPPDRFPALAAAARDHGLALLATPYDAESATAVADAVAGFRVPSGEVTNDRLLRAVGRAGLPTLLTTGMATVPEVASAVETLTAAGADGCVVCHAVAEHPTPVDHANLSAVERFRSAFDAPVGVLDRTQGATAATTGVALGASLVAEPFTDDPTSGASPFHATAADPSQLADVVARTHNAARAVRGGPAPTETELDARRTEHRSLVTRRAIAAGDDVCRGDLTVKRPGYGIDPARLDSVARGEWYATTDLPADAVVTWDDVRRE